MRAWLVRGGALAFPGFSRFSRLSRPFHHFALRQAANTPNPSYLSPNLFQACFSISRFLSIEGFVSPSWRDCIILKTSSHFKHSHWVLAGINTVNSLGSLRCTCEVLELWTNALQAFLFPLAYCHHLIYVYDTYLIGRLMAGKVFMKLLVLSILCLLLAIQAATAQAPYVYGPEGVQWGQRWSTIRVLAYIRLAMLPSIPQLAGLIHIYGGGSLIGLMAM